MLDLLNSLSQLNKLHSIFFNELIDSIKYDSRLVTAIPSFLFLTFTFLVTHRIIHRRTCSHTPLSMYIYRELGFQWVYFHIMRLWLIFINICQWASGWYEEALQDAQLQGEELWINAIHVEASLFTLLLCISLVPFGYYFFSWFWKATMPNFLIWVGEDPWIRSEIGISGHYLDRPPNFATDEQKIQNEGVRPCSSAQYYKRPKMKHNARRCRSLEILNTIHSNIFSR